MASDKKTLKVMAGGPLSFVYGNSEDYS